ncbi:MAG: hypothetical protein HOK61_07630 [Alphaproteobacteria bacterium]|nr:hypothetical protein [Alphaproteobacteria bacterium]
MSEKTKAAKAPKSGSDAGGKPAAKEKKASKDSASSDAKSDASADKSDGTTPEKSVEASTGSDSGAGKAQKDTVSTGGVHYGYFSSVRTPAYRKGWDEIFGKKDSAGDESEKPTARKRGKGKRATIKQPITVDLDIDELPDDLRAALGDEIRRQIKGKRINYDKLTSAGAVHWSISCEIRR